MSGKKSFDILQSFHISSGLFRGRFIRLEKTVDTIIRQHKDFSRPVAAVMAESLALSAVLAAAIKYDGVFTLQIQGNGPVPLVVIDVTSAGRMRGYLKFNQERIDRAQEIRKCVGEIEAAPHFLGAGHLAFTVDQGEHMERYQGVVELEGATLADCAHKYFRQSEQLETAIKIAIAPGDDKTPWRCSALMIQRMPDTGGNNTASDMTDEEKDDAWRTAVVLMSSLTDNEMLDKELAPEDALYRLFHQEQLVITEQKSLRFGCRCNKKKVVATINSFGPAQLDEMREDDGGITVTCQFCSAKYKFAKAKVDEFHRKAALKAKG